MLLPDLGRNLRAQELQPLLVGGDVAVPLLRVHAQCLADVLLRLGEALGVEVLVASGVANHGLVGLDAALDAVDDPLQDAGVLAESRPQEAAILATAEPVDQEDLWHLVAALFAHVDPVLQVVTGVVADEWQHGHRVVAQGAHGCLGGSGGLAGSHRRTDEGGVVPVAGLGHQWDGVRAAATEQDRGDRHATVVVVLRCRGRALGDRRAVAGVRVGGLVLGVRGPLVAQPVDEVLRLVLQALPPDILVVGQADVGVQGVARLHGLHRDRVGGVVGARRHAEEAILRVHGVQATVLAEAQPRDVVSDDLRAPARDCWLQHRQVGLTAGRREGGTDVVRLILRTDQLQDQHVLGHPALVAGHDGRDAQGVALLGQDGVAAVAGAVGPDFAVLREVGDVLSVVARPRDVLLTRLQRSADGVPALHELTGLVDLRQGLCTHAGHDAHGHHDVGGVGELDAQLRLRIGDRAHAERNDVHRAAAHGAGEVLTHLLAHLLGLDPVIGRTGVLLLLGADEGAGLDASHVGRVGACEEAIRLCLLVQLDEGASLDQLLG